MIHSLKRYFRLFSITLFFKKEKLILFNHFFDYLISRSFLKSVYSKDEKKKSLLLSVDWLLRSQIRMKDGGFGTYYIADGWTTSYPETSGYIIPTLFKSIEFFPEKKLEIEKSIVDCADWLLSIQKPSGGWQAYYMHHDREEVVFNTGQVLRGLITSYQLTNDKKYLTGIQKAADWLVDTQEENGSWIKNASMKQARVYDSYVAHPLLMVYGITNNEKYKQAAIKNLDWVLTQQKSNGWFSNADNTQKHNNEPILHTIAYTIDGLINSGILLNEKKYLEAGKKTADQLSKLFDQNKYLNGRFNKLWVASEYMICTGCAQMSIIWSLLFDLTKEEKYLVAIRRINDQLGHIQKSCLTIHGEANGGIPGSFPIWGKYEPFGFPNWVTKYYADALMEELKN